MIGGTVNYAVMLARGFSEKGHAVTLITETEGPAEQNHNYKIIRKPSIVGKFKLANHHGNIPTLSCFWVCLGSQPSTEVMQSQKNRLL